VKQKPGKAKHWKSGPLIGDRKREERRACKEIIRQIDKKLKGNREKLKWKKG
jgi:hypothetical protein